MLIILQISHAFQVFHAFPAVRAFHAFQIVQTFQTFQTLQADQAFQDCYFDICKFLTLANYLPIVIKG